jgi:hypothetical protein
VRLVAALPAEQRVLARWGRVGETKIAILTILQKIDNEGLS